MAQPQQPQQAAGRTFLGLDNRGKNNNCYMIAVIQALHCCDEFCEHITANTERHAGPPLHVRLNLLFAKLSTGIRSAALLFNAFKDEFLHIGNNRIHFTDTSEHDAHQFYLSLLNCLEAEENGAVGAVAIPIVDLRTARTSHGAWNLLRDSIHDHSLMELCAGLHQCVTQCIHSVRKHAYAATTWDRFWVSAIEIPNENRVFNVQEFVRLRPEIMAGVQCAKCGTQVNRTHSHVHMPPIFVIQLRLFRLDVATGNQYKIRRNIAINENIEVERNYYRLFAFISHYGVSSTTGQFYTTRRHDRDSHQWAVFQPKLKQNITVYQLTENLCSAYMLFYRKSQEALNITGGQFEEYQRTYLEANAAQRISLSIDLAVQTTSTAPVNVSAEVELGIGAQDAPPIPPVERQAQDALQLPPLPPPREEAIAGPSGQQRRAAEERTEQQPGPQQKKARTSVTQTVTTKPCDTEYVDRACAVRFEEQDDPHHYLFKLNIAQQLEPCVSYGKADQRNWSMIIENCLYFTSSVSEYSRQMEFSGYFLFWENINDRNILIAVNTKAASVSGRITHSRTLEINSVIPFIHENQIMCSLLVEEKTKPQTGLQRLWWRLGAEPHISGISEFSAWNPIWLDERSRGKYIGIFLLNGARLVMEDQRTDTNPTKAADCVMNCTLFLNTTFIAIFGELKVIFGNKRSPIYTFLRLLDDELIDPNFINIAHPILFLSPLREDNLAALWYMNLDFAESQTKVRKDRTAYLQIPVKADLNRISYLDWTEGLQLVRHEQVQRNWDINLRYDNACGLLMYAPYGYDQPRPQQQPIRLGRIPVAGNND